MNPQDLMYTQRRFSFLHLISLLVFLVFVGYSAYVFVDKSSLEKDVAAADSDITNLEEQISELEEQSLDEATAAQAILDQAEEDEVLWSDVISDLIEVTPFDIYYSSYSGTDGGGFNVSALGETYYAVAGLIEVLEDENKFKEVFIPSVSLANAGEDEMVGFTFSFTYDDTKVATQ